MLVLKSSVIQLLKNNNASEEVMSGVQNLFETKPILPEKALEIIQSYIFKKELGIDCLNFLSGILLNDQLLYIDNILLKKDQGSYIKAIKQRRQFFDEGLANAKDAIDKRIKELGLTRN